VANEGGAVQKASEAMRLVRFTDLLAAPGAEGRKAPFKGRRRYT